MERDNGDASETTSLLLSSSLPPSVATETDVITKEDAEKTKGGEDKEKEDYTASSLLLSPPPLEANTGIITNEEAEKTKEKEEKEEED